MTDKEMEQKFEVALKRWNETYPTDTIDSDDARYFFWAGAEMGLKACAELCKYRGIE